MNVRTVERVAWTLGVGCFLAVLLGGLLSPNPAAFVPYAAGSLAVALPVAHWYVGKQLATFPDEGAGRLSLLFLALFAVSFLGFEAVEVATAPETTAATLGRTVAVVAGLVVAGRAASGGYDRIRAALAAERSPR